MKVQLPVNYISEVDQLFFFFNSFYFFIYWIKYSLDSIVLYKFRSFTQMSSYNSTITFFSPYLLIVPPPSFSLLATTSLFSISVSLPLCFRHQFVVFFYIPHTHESYLSFLIYFSFQITFQVHPYCCKLQNSIIFYGWLFHHTHTHTHTHHTHTHTHHNFFTSLSSHLLMGT